MEETVRSFVLPKESSYQGNYFYFLLTLDDPSTPFALASHFPERNCLISFLNKKVQDIFEDSVSHVIVGNSNDEEGYFLIVQLKIADNYSTHRPKFPLPKGDKGKIELEGKTYRIDFIVSPLGTINRPIQPFLRKYGTEKDPSFAFQHGGTELLSEEDLQNLGTQTKESGQKQSQGRRKIKTKVSKATERVVEEDDNDDDEREAHNVVKSEDEKEVTGQAKIVEENKKNKENANQVAVLIKEQSDRRITGEELIVKRESQTQLQDEKEGELERERTAPQYDYKRAAELLLIINKELLEENKMLKARVVKKTLKIVKLKNLLRKSCAGLRSALCLLGKLYMRIFPESPDR